MPATPASCSRRRASATPARSPGRWPGRSFTVIGRPLPSPAARAIATALSGSSRRAAPAPVLQTLRTGHPMFRSIRSAPASATTAAASRITSASWPKSWIDTGCSSGWIRRNSRTVRSLPCLIPKLDAISETARPAPCRLACRRTNQFPMPARGASTTRLGIVWPPSTHGSCSERIRPILKRDCPSLGLVALEDQPEAGERQQRVDGVDQLAEGDDRAGQAARGDRLDLRAELVAQAGEDAVDLRGEAVDHARA